jgi:FAD/FMN-containing dehydrogenase
MATAIFLNTEITNLRAALHGELILPGDAAYETGRRVFNAAIDRHPAIIIRCVDATDIQRAVEFGRQNNLDIAVKGGGHSFPGFSTVDGGLMIDLSPMKAVTVNPVDRTARAEPGVKLGELMAAAQVYGLGLTVGTASDTGIAGLTLGGGVGHLMGKFGLTCDHARSFEVVTADSRLVRADANENPDLYWGLRGGGGNFGIVTAFEYQLHPLGMILGGLVAYPLSRARAVLEFYRDFSRELPDELTAMYVAAGTPTGDQIVGLAACYCGDLAEGERALAPLRKFGQPLIDGIQPMPYAGLFARIDPMVPAGRSYYVKGGAIQTLSDGAIDALVDSIEGRTSPYSHVFLGPVHGAATRVGSTETAFPLREEHHEFTLDASWEDDGRERHVQWARQSHQILQRYASERAYVNFLDDGGAAPVRAAYGPNYERLVALKNKYDPDNLFHLNQNIKPSTHSGQVVNHDPLE